MRSASETETAPFVRARPPGWLRDLFAAAVVFVTTFAPIIRFGGEATVLGITIAALPVVAMLLRRRRPWLTLALCVVAFVASALVLALTPFSALPTGIALFTIAGRHTRRTTVVAVLCVLAVLVPTSALHEGAILHPLTVLVVVMVGFFAAAGDAVRSRRAYVEGLTQRAVQAEQTREAEASRRVAEDRLRIARDLHDAVAHQISVINLHAGVAARAVDDDPAAAKAAMATVGTAARRVLGDIGDLLATLRSPDEAQLLAPAPGLDALDTLVDEFEASGLHVTVRIDGAVTELPSAPDLAAYRLVQESLTNAHKHGSAARAHVWVTRGDDTLRLVVTNPAPAAPDASAAAVGHGLLGIRERVLAAGGSLHTGRDGATFRVEAVLPLRETGGAA